MARRILLVDDSPFIGEALGVALRANGFEVEVARELWDFERADFRQPDLVIMDLVLQETFGDDVAIMMRATGRFDCPIILISAVGDDELQRRSSDAGLEGYVSKRGGLRAIVDRVRELFAELVEAPLINAAGFELAARERLRRILHLSSRADQWNVAALVSELHALAGDADLAQATTVASAVRMCRTVVESSGAEGSTNEVTSAIATLARIIDPELAATGVGDRDKILILDDTNFSRDTLIPLLDRTGSIVVEARTPAEARQKLRAADYDLVLFDSRVMAAAPSLSDEITEHLPNASLVALVPNVEQLLAQIEQTLSRARGSR